MQSKKLVLIILISMLITVPVSQLVIFASEPDKGKIFKDFTYDKDHLRCALRSNKKSDGTPRPNNFPDMMEFYIEVDDLNEAIGAEFIAQFWGGHIGTSDQKFSLNGNDFIHLPQINNTPTDPQCYYRNIMGESISIPMDHLKEGANILQLSCGPQTCYSFGWAWYFLYAATIRVFYDQSKPHPEGNITIPAEGDTIEDLPQMAVQVSDSNSKIKSVYFIGYYDDFDWKGTGEFRQWHFQYHAGKMKHHIGRAGRPPYQIVWKNKFVPDQTQPMKIKAIITDEKGMSYITPAVENIHLVRKGRSVKMYSSDDVPEKFSVRVGRRKSCTIDISDDLSKARSARLIVSTWSGATDDGSRHEIGINDVKLSDNFGVFHYYSYKHLHIPLEILQKGPNDIYIFSEFKGHGLEVNWPGPVIVVEYE